MYEYHRIKLCLFYLRWLKLTGVELDKGQGAKPLVGVGNAHENGTLKSKLCLRLSLKAIGEHRSHDGIKDSF